MVHKKHLILSQLQVHSAGVQSKNNSVVIGEGRILAIDALSTLQSYPSADCFEFPENYHLVPGFIDLHVHGANGSDVMDATPAALENISEVLAKEGTTRFLATTMTADFEQIDAALCAVRDFMKSQNNLLCAKIMGVHLEGPFISAEKAGAQLADKIRAPKKEYIEQWQRLSDNAIKLVTLAPELPNIVEFIQFLKRNNIIASIGHTNATYAESVAAIEGGCTHATHLFNAMRGMHQREPGAVTALLMSDKVMAELILDGIHLHPAIIELAIKLKGNDKIALVTDAMRAKCLCDGIYDLGGQTVHVKDNTAKLADGTLAGSVLTMDSALKKLIQLTKMSLRDAIKMTSENPARALGIFSQTGSIAVGKDADLVVLDDTLNVVMTICGGQVVFQR